MKSGITFPHMVQQVQRVVFNTEEAFLVYSSSLFGTKDKQKPLSELNKPA